MKPALTLLMLFVAAAPAAAQQYQYQPAPSYYQNDKAAGTVSGGAFGAITGAILGGRRNAGEGALIGAGIGALTGRVLGAQQDAIDEQRAATGYAMTAQANARAAQLAVTNADLIGMSQAGLSDEVIIGTITNRGGRFDLSPQGLIALKQNGVSDRVVSAAQRYSTAEGVPPSTVIQGAAPIATPAIVVSPAPVVRYHHYYHRPHPYPRRRAGGHIGIRF